MKRTSLQVINETFNDDPWLRSLLWLLTITSFLALGLSVASLIRSGHHHHNGGGEDDNQNPIPPPHSHHCHDQLQCFDSFNDKNRLSLYDDTVQSTLGINLWTNVNYNHNEHMASSWTHITGSDAIVCNKTGVYFIYFSIQIDTDPTLSSAILNSNGNGGLTISTHKKLKSDDYRIQNMSHHNNKCHPCHLKFALRGTQQYGGIGLLKEIKSSLTYSSKEDKFLNKIFFINATIGDVFRMQFKSSCPLLVISPYFNNTNLFNTFPSS